LSVILAKGALLIIARQVVARNPDLIIVFSAKLAGCDELGDTLG
jgi:hypothetical protein